jgi:hypothetical protein
MSVLFSVNRSPLDSGDPVETAGIEAYNQLVHQHHVLHHTDNAIAYMSSIPHTHIDTFNSIISGFLVGSFIELHHADKLSKLLVGSVATNVIPSTALDATIKTTLNHIALKWHQLPKQVRPVLFLHLEMFVTQLVPKGLTQPSALQDVLSSLCRVAFSSSIEDSADLLRALLRFLKVHKALVLDAPGSLDFTLKIIYLLLRLMIVHITVNDATFQDIKKAELSLTLEILIERVLLLSLFLALTVLIDRSEIGSKWEEILSDFYNL